MLEGCVGYLYVETCTRSKRRRRQRYNLSSLVVGCITTRAGAVHPYRFVTDILLRLLEEYPKWWVSFQSASGCLAHRPLFD